MNGKGTFLVLESYEATEITVEFDPLDFRLHTWLIFSYPLGHELEQILLLKLTFASEQDVVQYVLTPLPSFKYPVSQVLH